MKFLLLIGILLVIWVVASRLLAGDFMAPEEAARRVESGEAVLIDVREPAEWKDGVAEPALLLSLSDLRGKRQQWQQALEQHKDKELILYCRTGNRSATAASILEKEGFRVANAGGFSAWRKAGLPERKP
jgi:rhodanese-related sulfurtransferase